MTTQIKTCPKCQSQLPVNAPAGICPKCLIQAGLASQGDVGSRSMKPTTLASGFVPPEPEELAKHFPQLEIIELVGKGGMGAVYKARQRGLDRLVAVKVLPPEVSRDPSFADRFAREARALARLSHNHIVLVYDFGQISTPITHLGGLDGGEGSLFFIVMEFVDGINLRQAIQTDGLSPADALTIVPQICEALQYAHDEGIVHRDIKPENILIDKKGRVKIADFGLAKLLGQDASDRSLTATHQVMGTLRYMAPEQMQGAREVDHRADIYSLGVVFYELLTGELPMGKFAPPSKRVQVDVRLDEIVLRALEQEPQQRYQHASEVKTDVDAIVQSGSASRKPQPAGPTDKVTIAERAWDSTDVLVRLIRSLLPGIAAFLASTALLVLILWLTGRPGQRAEEFQRNPVLNWAIILGVPGVSAAVLTFMLFLYHKSFFVRSVTMNAAGLTMHSGSQPSRFLRWDEIAALPAFREHWWGCVSSSVASDRDWFGIDSSLGCRRYFRPDDRREFLAAIRRFAPPDAAWAEALRAESENVAARSKPKPTANSEPAIVPSRYERQDRLPLALLLATVDLFAAVGLLLILYNLTPYPESMSRLWHWWSQVEIALGYIGGTGLFVASIAVLVGRPWARKMMLGVCFCFMAQWVFAMPDLTQVAFPLGWDEVRRHALSLGDSVEEADRKASLAVALWFAVLIAGLTWLIGHLVYFTRPRVIAAFDSQNE